MPKQVNENLQEIEANDEKDYGARELDNIIIKSLESAEIRSKFELTNLESLSGKRRNSSKIKISYQNQDLYFLTKNLRWLGRGNPGNVKRMQVMLNKEEKQLICQKSFFLIGIYHFDRNFIACYLEVNKKSKKERKWNNSSVMQVKTKELKETLSNKDGCYRKSHELGAIYLFKRTNDLFLHLFHQLGKNFKYFQAEVDRSFAFQSWFFKNLTQKEKTEIKKIEESPRLKETTKEQLINSRVGQGEFRKEVIKEFGRCIITEVVNRKLLIASHIKPWKECNNEERLDKNNGLLLTPTYDKLFDLGLISFSNKGEMLISNLISETNRSQLGLKKRSVDVSFGDKRKKYLEFHRKKIFKNKIKFNLE